MKIYLVDIYISHLLIYKCVSMNIKSMLVLSFGLTAVVVICMLLRNRERAISLFAAMPG